MLMNPEPCKHLANYKVKYGLSGFNMIKKYVKTTPYGKTMIDKSKFENEDNNEISPFCCCLCKGSSRGRFLICLMCSSVCCCDVSGESNHALLHSESESGHEIVVDMERAELYCCVCCDQVYDPDFDSAVMAGYVKKVSGGEKRGSLSKRKRLSFCVDLDLKTTKRLVLRRDQRWSKSCYPLGLRGLNNLGNTCFMNSVLQAMLHAPPFRNYFLSDRHSKENCHKRSTDPLCLPCDMDVIFSAAFSGDRTPYSPAQFLYSWWQHSENLASYEQQDAHEFFISMLDRIHEKERKQTMDLKDNGDCMCIAHKVFSGLLRSDVTCTSCGFTSTTYDPCMDISLDLIANTLNAKDTGGGKPSKLKVNKGVATLVACLDLFTRPEKLGSDQKLFCQNCQEKHDAVKQMSVRKLPLVLCLHIKRFEHSLTRKMSRKIDRHLQFPFSLEMKPFLSPSIVRKRYGNRIFTSEGEESEISTEYEIFAVVTHSGMLESGHYVTYLRLKNQWYKCDDAWVTEVDDDVVRASQCYLVYYVQKGLYFKGTEDLSCQPMSPRGDAFVPIAGCC